jgi:hypothetical protein
MRAPNGPDLEWRERTAKIRAAARKGKRSAEIAKLYQLPVAAVERVLTPAGHARLSDPVQLLLSQQEEPGMAPADVQMYWVGFLTAAGRIWGQGSSLTLVVTLGEGSREYVEPFIADLVTDHIRCELCHSSAVGWQAYLRDQHLCKALFPWGIPSDLQGDDAALLEDLPREFAVPFIRGYVDGNWPSPQSSHRWSEDGFTLRGTPAILAGINSMVVKYWGVAEGMVTRLQDRAELRFSDPEACRAIHRRLNTYGSRVRPDGEKAPPRG